MANESRQRHGAATVEFAVVLPLLVLLVFGSVELTRGLMLRHSADNAAYEAARTAIVPGATAEEAITRATELPGTVRRGIKYHHGYSQSNYGKR